jgi:hypothetical protein
VGAEPRVGWVLEVQTGQFILRQVSFTSCVSRVPKVSASDLRTLSSRPTTRGAAAGAPRDREAELLLRSDAGDLFGLFAQNGQPTRFFAAPLTMNLGQPNPLEGVDFFDTESGNLRARSNKHTDGSPSGALKRECTPGVEPHFRPAFVARSASLINVDKGSPSASAIRPETEIVGWRSPRSSIPM